VSKKPSASENYGESVSIEAGRIAVGAPNPGGVRDLSERQECFCQFNANKNCIHSLYQIGTVYLYYNRTATEWDFFESVTGVNEEEGISGNGILYGKAVGVSATALGVGAPRNDLAAEDSGSVYIYDVIEGNCNPAKFPTAISPSSNALQSSNGGSQYDEPM
jgi:hypothetical protein